MQPALQPQLDAVKAHVKNVLPAEVISIFLDDAAAMSSPEFTARALREGAPAPRFTLPNAAGQPVSLAELLAHGPVVLTFYRGAWCPYCNIQLKAYQGILAEVQALGASLVAISPQKPDGSLSIKEKNDLQFEVLSDAGNGVARQFGLVYTLRQLSQETSQKLGNDIGAANADGTWDLPVPATYVLDRAGQIRLAYVEGDYTRRLEPARILEALRELA
ncbi:hypothetical protein A0257_21455 [Hymenobacter psoromatis]|nr:hypothetical protein A0257_21455 [Hymenobacter psoromatis]